MEVLERVGTPEQKARWLEPLLNGEIRSAFAMTEPDVGSSDAKNVRLQALRDGDDYVLNGEKYYISGAGDPRCKIMIVMCQTNPEAPVHQQQSQILVPMDTPGVQVMEPMEVFGRDDAPHGHMRIRFTDVRVPAANMLLGEGRGFEISQVRLGPGRIHHCMRAIGQGEKALELMVRRGKFREAFGKPILNLGKNMETVSRARIELDACKLMVLKAAKAMDVLGNAQARVYVSAVKAMVPEKVCQIIDQAIQIHGATGVSQWTPLAGMYASQRTLRLADGPDEVHHFVVARHEAGQYASRPPAVPRPAVPASSPAREAVARTGPGHRGDRALCVCSGGRVTSRVVADDLVRAPRYVPTMTTKPRAPRPLPRREPLVGRLPLLGVQVPPRTQS